MLAENHRQAAEDLEYAALSLQTDPRSARLAIEGAWAAGQHWIAFGCQTKHQRHQESHSRLGTFLRSQGEKEVAEWWDEMERIRQGGLYGGGTDHERVQRAFQLLQNIHTWASQ